MQKKHRKENQMQFLIYCFGKKIKISYVLFIALFFLFSPALSLAAPVISGRVFYLGNSLGGVVMKFSGEGQTTTDPDGYYSKSVTSGWSGTVTPSKTGYEFAPPR